MGNLYIVSTPIGNLQDISIRALEVLKNVDLILAEDTRRSSLLLKHFSIRKSLLSFHEHNEKNKEEEIVDKLKEGTSIALISDAGTPTISDPGFRLVCACINNGISVIPIPGASSILAALVASGFPTDSFSFLGYVPRKTGKRKEFYKKIYDSINKLKFTVIFFESPHRICRTLEEIAELFPTKDLVIARELTKINEEIIRGKAKELAKKLTNRNFQGEITILLRK